MTRTEYEIKAKNLKKEVCRLHKLGYSKQEIADATGYSKSYVERIIYAINGPAEKKIMSDADKAKIVKLRNNGKTIKEISAEIGFSMSAVQRYLKEQEEEKKQNEEPEPVILAKTAHIYIPPGTVIYESVRERDEGVARKVKWTFVKQYPHHALFASQYGKKRCFTNAELMNKGIYR